MRCDGDRRGRSGRRRERDEWERHLYRDRYGHPGLQLAGEWRPFVTYNGFPVLTLNALGGNDNFSVTPFYGAGGWQVTANVNGNAPTSLPGDQLTVEGSPAADLVNYTPGTTGSGSLAINGGAAAGTQINFTTIEAVTYDGQGGGDTLTYTGPTVAGEARSVYTYIPARPPESGTIIGKPTDGTAFTPLNFQTLGTAQGVGPGVGTVVFTNSGATHLDTLEVEGTPASDAFTVTPDNGGTVRVGPVGQDNSTSEVIQTPGINFLNLLGLGGADVFNLNGALPYLSTIVDGSDTSTTDPVNLTGAIGPVTVNVADEALSTNTTITGYGGTVTLLNTAFANLNTNGNTLTVNGHSTNDKFIYTPTGATSGTLTDNFVATTFNFSNAGTFTINGGADLANLVTLEGSAARDLFEIDQGGRTAQVLTNNVNLLEPVTLGAAIAEMTADGQGGINTFQVIPGAGLAAAPQDNLTINVDGGTGGQSNALAIVPAFVPAGTTSTATLPATSFVVVNQNPVANSGIVRVFQNAIANPDINYQNVEVVSPRGRPRHPHSQPARHGAGPLRAQRIAGDRIVPR